MNDIVVLIIGYIVGCVISWIIFRPMKSFQQGYDIAKAHYSNWEKGFDQGWEAAMKVKDGDTQ